MPIQGYIVGIVGFAILNGIYNPALLPHSTGMAVVMTMGMLNAHVSVLVFIAYLLGATLTIMLAGIPAALYERMSGSTESTSISMWIWLACTALVTLPAVMTFFRIGGF